MTFPQFKKQCAAAGVVARDCGNGHWRVEQGIFQVNYYPLSKRKTIYVNLSTKHASIHYGDAAKAISLAMGEGFVMLPAHQRVKRSKGKALRAKKALLKNQLSVCMWCKKSISRSEATLEHIVPLSAGGIDHKSNYGISCEPCNQGRSL